MIKLTDNSGKPDRLIQGVQFVDGKAEIPDIMMPKAEALSKFYNVSVELTFEPKSSVMVDGDGSASDIPLHPSKVGPESVDSDDDEVKTDKVNTWGAAPSVKEDKPKNKK